VADEIIEGYKLQSCMGTRINSQVWEVVEVSSGRHFAMKLLLPEKANNKELRSQLFHEANVGKQLAHQNVIKIVHVGTSKDHPMFVMEFFPSGAVQLRIVRKQYDFLREHAHSILKQAATGFAYMNASGWVHRDVKPDNLLVNSAGEVRIIDFAIAQHIQKPSFFSNFMRRFRKPDIKGTRSYMSPEQIRGLPLDGRADIYSFGATAYELVTYRPPFRAASQQELLQKQIIEKPAPPQSFNKDVTDEFGALVLKMLAKKPEQRPQSFHEVLKGLNAVKVFKTPVIGKKE
jgi:eukaryotic-like serine/threonine-protein kinase